LRLIFDSKQPDRWQRLEIFRWEIVSTHWFFRIWKVKTIHVAVLLFHWKKYVKKKKKCDELYSSNIFEDYGQGCGWS